MFSLDSRYAVTSPTAGHVVLFISHLYQLGLTAQTITTKLSAISYYFKLLGRPDVTTHFLVQKALVGVRKLASSGDSRLPVTSEMLTKLLNKASWATKSPYQTKLLRAMMALAFHALLRPGECTTSQNNLQFQDVELSTNQIIITFRHFKHHVGKPVSIVILAHNGECCPVKALREYLEVRGPKSGPLFCHRDYHPVSYFQFQQWFQLLLKVCAFKGCWSPHSFRIGGATMAAARGVSAVLIQQMGRWKSNAYLRYIRLPSIKF